MLYLEYMQAQGHSIPASRGAVRERLQVRLVPRHARSSKAEVDIGVLSDATKSVSRAYINNFQDKGKQVAIDMFLVSCVMISIVLFAHMKHGGVFRVT